MPIMISPGPEKKGEMGGIPRRKGKVMRKEKKDYGCFFYRSGWAGEKGGGGGRETTTSMSFSGYKEASVEKKYGNTSSMAPLPQTGEKEKERKEKGRQCGFFHFLPRKRKRNQDVKTKNEKSTKTSTNITVINNRVRKKKERKT